MSTSQPQSSSSSCSSRSRRALSSSSSRCNYRRCRLPILKPSLVSLICPTILRTSRSTGKRTPSKTAQLSYRARRDKTKLLVSDRLERPKPSNLGRMEAKNQISRSESEQYAQMTFPTAVDVLSFILKFFETNSHPI